MQPVQFRMDELRYMPELRNPTNQSSSGVQNRLQLIMVKLTLILTLTSLVNAWNRYLPT